MTAALVAEETKPADQRRQRRDLQQHIYRELLGNHGVEVSSDDWVVDAGVNPEQAAGTAEADSSDQREAEGDGSRLVTQRGRIFSTETMRLRKSIFHKNGNGFPLNSRPFR